MKYKLRTSKRNGRAKLYFQLRKRGLNMVNVCSGIEVDVAKWSNVKQRSEYLKSVEGIEVLNAMRTLENALMVLMERDSVTSQDVLNLIDDLNKGEARAQEKKRQAEEQARKKRTNREILTCLRNFIQGITEGTITKGTKNLPYKDNTIRNYKAFEGVLLDFFKDSPRKSFDELTEADSVEFRRYLSGRYIDGTVSKQMRCFHFLCKYAKDKKYSSNSDSLTWWRCAEPKEDDMRAEVYLTDEEVDALSEMELANEMDDLTRDMFVFSYVTGQRYSDINGLGEDSFFVEQGKMYFSITQKKTEKKVMVRLIDERALEVARKRNFRFPIMNAPAFNLRIKKILSELAAEVPTLREWTKTTLSIREQRKEERFAELLSKKERTNEEEAELNKLFQIQKIEGGMGNKIYFRDSNGTIKRHKYQLVSTHTARRSYVTNAIQMKIGYADIMRTTGHKKVEMVRRYDKTQLQEGANLTADEWARARAERRSEERKRAN